MYKEELKSSYKNKIKNQLYIILCEREKNGSWEKCIESLEIELMGVFEKEETLGLYILLGKIAYLKFLKYEYFRKVIFECMNLVDKYL